MARSLKSTLRRYVLFPCLILLLQYLAFLKQVLVGVACLVYRRRSPAVVRTPGSRFEGLRGLGYTFSPNYVELPIGGGKTLPRLHYVDEGPKDARETVLCLHGEPSWSFLYRHVIPVLVRAGYRVVAPDFIGFGKSDKYTFPEAYTHELHTMTLRLLLQELRLTNVTLVCQDWGGLVGLSVVKDCPHFFSKLVIMNTGLPAGSEFSWATLGKVIPFMLWRSFAQCLGTSIPIYQVFKKALFNASPAVLNGYSAPFPSSEYKAGAAQWPLLVPIHSHTQVAADMQATRDFLYKKWRNPVLVMFSDRDPITRGQEHTFMRLLPHARSKVIEGAGHFLQEDKGEDIAAYIVQFIKDNS